MELWITTSGAVVVSSASGEATSSPIASLISSNNDAVGNSSDSPIIDSSSLLLLGAMISISGAAATSAMSKTTKARLTLAFLLSRCICTRSRAFPSFGPNGTAPVFVLSAVIAFVLTSFFFRRRRRRPFFPEVIPQAQKSIPTTKLLRAPIIPFREKDDDERKDVVVVEHGIAVVVVKVVVLIVVIVFRLLLLLPSLRDDLMMASEDCSRTFTDDKRACNPKEDKTPKDLFFFTARLRTYKTLNLPPREKNLRRIRETKRCTHHHR